MEKAVAPPKSLLTAWLAGVWNPRTVYLLVDLDRQVQLPITWLKTSPERGEGADEPGENFSPKDQKGEGKTFVRSSCGALWSCIPDL